MEPTGRTLVIGCGAIARELLQVSRQIEGLDIECLPAIWHNRPENITPAVEEKILAGAARYDKIFVAYGDCGTGGVLDAMLERHQVERLPGAHCYEFFSGIDLFAEIAAQELGTFYLTDYLTRHFHRLVWEGLGLDRHPHLRHEYFRNYTRLVYLSQTEDLSLIEKAREAAAQLGLTFEHRHVGLGLVESELERFAT